MQTKFKVGDTVRCVSSNHSYITFGRTYVIKDIQGEWYRVITDRGGLDGYRERTFELVDTNPVLTPEEVFEHLRKGTKLQIWSRQVTPREDTHVWVDIHEDFKTGLLYEKICSKSFRIKPEPEVIELNGKRYKLIEE